MKFDTILPARTAEGKKKNKIRRNKKTERK